jgi:hypothetical protein
LPFTALFSCSHFSAAGQCGSPGRTLRNLSVFPKDFTDEINNEGSIIETAGSHMALCKNFLLFNGIGKNLSVLVNGSHIKDKKLMLNAKRVIRNFPIRIEINYY